MKKTKVFLMALIFGLGLGSAQTVRAEDIEVFRGEEAETEVYLEGSEEIYSLMGELESTEEYVLVKEPDTKNYRNYQATETSSISENPCVLLSGSGGSGYGLSLRLKVEGLRIGTGSIMLKNLQAVDENGQWIEDAELPDITVHVLPNPLLVSLSGTEGSNGWYASPVMVSIIDKDPLLTTLTECQNADKQGGCEVFRALAEERIGRVKRELFVGGMIGLAERVRKGND